MAAPLSRPGMPLWMELITTDGAKAEAFYGALFGWRFVETAPEFGGYRMLTLPDGTVVGGGMVKDATRMGDIPDSFSLYLGTPDIDALSDRVVAHGGRVVVPPMPVGDLGRMAFYVDAVGAGVGGWEPGQLAGMPTGDTHGMGVWFDLMTTDFTRACDFQRDVFGWEVTVMGEDGWRYGLDAPYQSASAGICDGEAFLAAGTPSYWRVYVHVDDTDAACAKVVELGGAVLDGPTDSPHGRVATVVDDQGAQFQIIG